MRDNTGYEKFEDRLRALLDLVRRDGTVREAGGSDAAAGNVAAQRPIGEDSQDALGSTSGLGWDEGAGYEFDGIRSEVDFRRAMAIEEKRLRGTWSQRTLRAFSAIRATFWKSRPLRFLR